MGFTAGCSRQDRPRDAFGRRELRWRDSPALRLARAVSGAALSLCLLISISVPAARALQSPIRWTLQDQRGDRWVLVVLQQNDPAYPPGWRLRLSALGGQPPLDHHNPLRLEDGQGGVWQLANRSEELVPPGEAPLPPAAAQFDVTGLQPAPSGFLPLRLLVPQVPQVNTSPNLETALTVGAEVVGALRELAMLQQAEPRFSPSNSASLQRPDVDPGRGRPRSREADH